MPSVPTCPAEQTALPAIAAIVHRPDGDTDARVADFARSLRQRGWQVRGLIQETSGPDGCTFRLIDLDSGHNYPISQNLGRLSASCRLDPGGIAEASTVMRKIAGEGADLAIFSRYAGVEATGGGFSAEMLAVMSAGIPCLTIVPEKHLPAWRRFTGGLAVELAADREILERWFFSQQNLPGENVLSAPVQHAHSSAPE